MGEKKLITAINKKIKQQIIDHMKVSLDGPSIIAQKFNISPSTFYQWKREDFDFAAALEIQEEFKLDWVESKMNQNIEMGDSSMIQFYLKYRGKKKGYIEPRLQVDHTTNGESINKIEVEIHYTTLTKSLNEGTDNQSL